METMLYRQRPLVSLTAETAHNDMEKCYGKTAVNAIPQDDWALQPSTFYPCISKAELTMWDHWLPTTTVFECCSQYAHVAFFNRLKQLNAPQEVVEECRWAWAMDLFEAYELKTPERRDLRDPLVLGRAGTQRYLIALWGESLRPLEEIHELVQKSLTIRQRAGQWLLWSMLSGAAFGLAFGLWLAGQTPYEGDQLGVGLTCMALGSLFVGLPFYVYTPENRQQHFLDRYRQ